MGSKRCFESISNSLSQFLILATVTINELLLGFKRSIVCFMSARHDFKTLTKFIVKTFGTVAYYIQSTATFRAIRGEGRNNHVPTLFDRVAYCLNVSLAVF